MEWPYIGDGFYTLDLDLSYDSLNHKSDEVFKNFFHDSLHWGQTYLHFLDYCNGLALFRYMP